MRAPLLLISMLMIIMTTSPVLAAYHHMGEVDSPNFIADYPDKKGTKLDSCSLCHAGGEYINHKGKLMTVGSCQWCHYITDYGKNATGYEETQNPYGVDYYNAGRNAQALIDIQDQDSDGDGFSNLVEIEAGTFPGDPEDNPDKVPAPSRTFSLEDLEDMQAHSQVLLMNTHKSGDAYRQFTGVPMSVILKKAGVLDTAESVTVFAPDGWSQTHPINGDGVPNETYCVNGNYPEAVYHYHTQADYDTSDVGWCDYTVTKAEGLEPGSPIVVEGGLKLILAYKSDGQYLTKGELDADNRLNGEGPYRVITPQITDNPPDQASTSEHQDVIWPFTGEWDHNAGFSTRSVTMIRVNPLPEGTTDIDILEAGWNYIDEGKILVYGAISKDSGSSSGCSVDNESSFSFELLFLLIGAGVLAVIRLRMN